MNLEKLQSDCRLKAKNLKTALESVVNNDFQSRFLLENFIECKNESLESTEKLLEYLQVAEKEEA